jgi:hypothetical protein
MTAGRKNNTCKKKLHAKEESMKGMEEVITNHVRVRVLEYNG